MPTRRLFTRGLAASLAWHGALAWALDRPAGTVVLTLNGRIRIPNQGANATFDMAMLAGLPQPSFITHTPWYAQPRKFTGPLLRDVVAAAGGHGSTLRAPP